MIAFEINKSEFEKMLPSTKIAGLIKKPVSIPVLTLLIEKQI